MSEDVLRIAVFGPESTGKTRLAAKLAEHFRAPLVTEYAREFWDAHGVITLEDIPAIAREQWRREDAAACAAAVGGSLEDKHPDASGGSGRFSEEKATEDAVATSNLMDEQPPRAGGRKPVVICDTEALTTVLWSDLLYGTTPDEVRRGAERRAKHYALYLLLDTDVPFAADPQRCFPDPDDREKCRRIWHGALERRGLPYVWIRGDWDARERAAIAAIKAQLADRE